MNYLTDGEYVIVGYSLSKCKSPFCTYLNWGSVVLYTFSLFSRKLSFNPWDCFFQVTNPLQLSQKMQGRPIQRGSVKLSCLPTMWLWFNSPAWPWLHIGCHGHLKPMWVWESFLPWSLRVNSNDQGKSMNLWSGSNSRYQKMIKMETEQ